MDITKLSDLDLASLILPQVQQRDIANENLRAIAAEMGRRKQATATPEPEKPEAAKPAETEPGDGT